MEQNNAFKTCPFCQEQIRKEAVKCRYCGEWLEEEAKNARAALTANVPTKEPPQGLVASVLEKENAVMGKPSKSTSIAQQAESPLPPASPATAIPSKLRTFSQPTSPAGIGGWLVFFCVNLTILSPLGSLLQMVSDWEQCKPAFGFFPSIKHAIIWENFGITAILVYTFVIGCTIWSGTARGREIAKRFLLIRFFGVIGVEVIALIMMSGLPSKMFASSIGSFVGSGFREFTFFLIWWFYFKKSKRVKNTYGDEGTQENVVKMNRHWTLCGSRERSRTATAPLSREFKVTLAILAGAVLAVWAIWSTPS